MLALAEGLRLRQFDGEGGAVAFIPSSADTHLLDDMGVQVLVWLSHPLRALDRQQAVSAMLGEDSPDEAASDVEVAALDSLVGELLLAGLLVELAP